MQDITDLVSDLDYECQDNRNFHNTMRNKFDKIDSNSAEIGELKDLLESLRLQVEDLKNSRSSFFVQSALDKIYPIGSVYISLEEKNPSTFLGGNWSQISGRFLLGVDSTHRVGTLGGEEFHKLTTEELPAHTHAASTDAKGKHTHTRGTMEIKATNKLGIDAIPGYNTNNTCTGAFTLSNPWTDNLSRLLRIKNGPARSWRTLEFTASKGWTGATSECPDHTHTVTVNNTGSGQSHNNMPPYIAVYMYRRIS